jgi:thioredoxin-like negative regulator of GroEL
MFKPVVQQASSETGVNINYIDAQENTSMASAYSVTSVPTMIFLKNGQVVDRTTGAMPKTLLINKIKQHS